MGHICALCMDRPGFIFAELPDTRALREAALACQGHGYEVIYGGGTIQVILCRECKDNLKQEAELKKNDEEIEAAITTSLEDDELVKAIAASISDHHFERALEASAPSAAARESLDPVAGANASEVGKTTVLAEAVGTSSSSCAAAREALEQPVAGTAASPDDDSDDELAKALAASLTDF